MKTRTIANCHADASEPFNWDRAIAALKAWDQAERQFAKATTDMTRDCRAIINGDGE